MKRLTNKNHVIVQMEVWERLAAIEDILGDEYDLERLKHLVTGDTFTEEDMGAAYESGFETGLKQSGLLAHVAEKAVEMTRAVMEEGLIEKAVAMAAVGLQPVVRCKDCKWYQIRKWDDGAPEYDCRKTQGLLDVKPDDFCSYGVRTEAAKHDGRA